MKQVTNNNKRSKKIQNADKDGLRGWFLFLFWGWFVLPQGVTVVDRVCGVVVGLSVFVMGGIFFGDVVFIGVCGWLGDVYFSDC
jgi:hypothetical protein